MVYLWSFLAFGGTIKEPAAVQLSDMPSMFETQSRAILNRAYRDMAGGCPEYELIQFHRYRALKCEKPRGLLCDVVGGNKNFYLLRVYRR